MSENKVEIEQGRKLAADFASEFPGIEHEARVMKSDQRSGWYWIQVLYTTGDAKRYATQEIRLDVLKNEAKRADLLREFFNTIRYDLGRDA